MKTISTAVTAIALTLTGCAHTGYYQQSSYGYDTGYGGYTTVDRYYQSAPSYYYQPGGVYSYEYYTTPSYGSGYNYGNDMRHRRNFDHDHDRNQDRDRRDRWRNGNHGHDNRRGSNLYGNDDRDNRDRWNWNSRQNQDFDRAVDRADRQRHDGRSGSAIDNVGNWRRDNQQDDNQSRHSRSFGEAVSGLRSGGEADNSGPNRRGSPFGGEGRRQRSRD